jgi:GTP-binding protein
LDPLRIVDAQFVAGAAQIDQLPAPTGVEIAFAGRSNVGKSSLMNALCGRKNLVRTSSTPGCTRQISFFEVRTKDGAVATLVDLPGYGYAKRSKGERGAWANLIEEYLLARPTLSVVVALVDVRRGVEEDDAQLLELLRSRPRVRRPNLGILTAATKLDKLPSSQRRVAVDKATKSAPGELIAVSVELPETVERLWRRLRVLSSLGAVPTTGEAATQDSPLTE